MNALLTLNDAIYTAVEMMLCDIEMAYFKARIAIRNRRIASLEAQLKALA